MQYLNSGMEWSWIKALGEDPGAAFPIADVWGMPTWLFVAIVIILLLAGFVWFWIGPDLLRYIKIRRM